MPPFEVAGANKGTLQRIDERNNCLKITASRGLSDAFLKYFETVYPDTNTSCAAAMMRRMRVVVSDASTSYLTSTSAHRSSKYCARKICEIAA
jgi:hypothetical protein